MVLQRKTWITDEGEDNPVMRQPAVVPQQSKGSPKLPLEPTVSAIDLRHDERFRILQRCLVLPANLAPTEGAPAPEGWHCIAYNISATGIGITLPLNLREGTELTIRAWGLHGVDVLTARIIHTKAVGFLWFAGCELSKRLSEAELEIWKNASASWVDEQS
jgi:PilZ domain